MKKMYAINFALISTILFCFTHLTFTNPLKPSSAINTGINNTIPKPFTINLKVQDQLEDLQSDLPNWIREKLSINKDFSFVLKSSFTDKIGYSHFKYFQTYKGYKVQDAIVIVHTKNGKIVSVNGEFHKEIKEKFRQSITTQDAIRIGQQSIKAEVWAWEKSQFPAPEIFLVASRLGYRFAYKTDIFAHHPMVRKWLFIDIETGQIIDERNRIHQVTVPGEAQCFFHGTQTIQVDSISPTQFMLRDYSRGNGIITRDLAGSGDLATAVDIVDDNNVWDMTTNNLNAAYDVHWAVGEIYDYMLEVHGWNSFDNQGKVINNYIRHSNNFNALWNGSGMVFGHGNSTTAYPFTAGEVVGHEFMHAYSEYTVDWNNSGTESGSLNESFSDVFSVIFEHSYSPSTANYFIGDAILVSGEPFRNMEDPNALDAPDTYEGNFWSATGGYTNSNVFNYCFYLLTQGGTGTNDNGDMYAISPLAMKTVSDILFRAMSVYMTPNTDFADVRTHGIQSCIDLYGPCSEELIQFTNACYAIGVGEEYSGPPQTQIQFSGTTMINESITFSSNASMATNWDWDFGDGNSSTEEMPVHAYQTMGNYQVVLVATYSAGCVSTDTIDVEVGDITGLQEQNQEAILIYPNPVVENMIIEITNKQPLNNIRLTNILGQVIVIPDLQIMANDQYKLNLKHLPSGIYFILLESKKGTFITKQFYLN